MNNLAKNNIQHRRAASGPGGYLVLTPRHPEKMNSAMWTVLFAVLLTLSLSLPSAAQEPPAELAKTFMREGDYTNAILILNKAVEQQNNNTQLKKDLAFAYYMNREYSRAQAVIKPITEGKEADIQGYQLLGMVYKATEERKEAEKMYKAALKKFPNSAVLHNEYGEMLWSRKDFPQAAEHWEKGIRSDPNYPGNYYNAAKYYYLTADKVWGLVYGEIFINLESFSRRTPEIKSLLLEGYKKLFTDADIMKNQNTKNEFATAYLETMQRQAQTVATGVTPDALSALRTRFILDWFNKYGEKFPYRLFDHHKQLAKEGMFDAYNQWIFAAASNLSAFQQWIATHNEAYEKFTTLQRSRVFKLPADQYYGDTK